MIQRDKENPFMFFRVGGQARSIDRVKTFLSPISSDYTTSGLIISVFLSNENIQ